MLCFHLHLLLDDFFELHNIGCKVSDSLSELFGCHRIFIDHPTERLLVHVDFGNIHRRRFGRVELLGDGIGRAGKFIQQRGRNGQTVATGQLADLIRIAERCAHDDRVVPVFLVVVVNVRYRNNAGVFFGFEPVDALVLLVPVQNATNERTDQRAAGFGTRNCLRFREDSSCACTGVVEGGVVRGEKSTVKNPVWTHVTTSEVQ